MAAAVCVLQMPVFLAAIDLGDAAAEIHRDVLEQAAGDCTHARHADPARLFVGRGAEHAVLIVVELRLPFGRPASGHPLLELVDKAPVAGGEVLGAEIKGTGIATLAGHASAATVAFVE